jgi:hypothetical protein
MPGLMNDVILDVNMHGLGVLIVDTQVQNVPVHARQRVYPTPIDGERIDIRAIVNLKRLPDPDTTRQIANLFYKSFVEDYIKDFPIWETKRYRERPLLAANDGPVMVYRRWAQGFYGA